MDRNNYLSPLEKIAEEKIQNAIDESINTGRTVRFDKYDWFLEEELKKHYSSGFYLPFNRNNDWETDIFVFMGTRCGENWSIAVTLHK